MRQFFFGRWRALLRMTVLVATLGALFLSALVAVTVDRAQAQVLNSDPVCDVGTLDGLICVEVGDAPQPGADVCPTGAGVLDTDGECFRLVPQVGGDSCPVDTTADPDGTACRAPVELVEQIIEQEDSCPDGFSESTTFEDICLFAEPALRSDGVCPQGGRGEAGSCYIAKLEVLECADGVLAGDVCVIEGPPPTVPGYRCPVGLVVLSDGDECFTLELRVDGACPVNTAPDPGSDRCRRPVALVPLPQVCVAGFGLLNGRCIRYSLPAGGLGCPGDAPVDDFGVCRMPVADRTGQLYCSNPGQELQGADCVITVALDPGCGYNEVVVGCEPVPVCPEQFDSPQFDLVPNYGGLCARYVPAMNDGPTTCPFGARGVAGACYILVAKGPAGDSGIAVCPSGSVEDSDGACRKPVADARAPFTCPLVHSVLNGRVCAVVAAPVEITSGCPDGFTVDAATCVSREPALLSDPACPDGATGSGGACMVAVLPFPTIDAFCDEGSFSGLVCVVIDDPLTVTFVCPVSATVREDGDECYTLIGPIEPTCPLGTTREPGSSVWCRRPVDKRPVAASCADGFIVVVARCVRYDPPVADSVVCPVGPEASQCRRTTGDALGVFYCEAPWAVLQFTDCIYTAPNSGSCTTAQALAGACEQPTLVCPAGFSSDDSLGGICARFEPAAQQPDSCPAGARGTVDDCYILVARDAGDCPIGSVEDDNGDCRKRVANARGPYVCDDPDAALNGRSCVFTARFELVCGVDRSPCGGPVEIEFVCATSARVFSDGDACYRLVSFEDSDCPVGTLPDVDSTLCREPVDLVPGPLVCVLDFELVDGACLRFSDALIPPGTGCPTGACEDEGIESTQGSEFGSALVTDRPTMVSFNGCAGGIATYSVSDGMVAVAWGDMVESEAGVYIASYSLADAGTFLVTTQVVCPDGSTADAALTVVFIDPSGVILDCSGNPVEGAEVTLLRAATSSDVPVAVADGDSTVMDPSVNVANPSTSDADGAYRWDVVVGFYQVTASFPGQPSVSSAVLEVPPERTDVDLVFTTLNCPVVLPGPSRTLPSPTITNPPPSTAVAAPLAVASEATQPGLAVTGSESQTQAVFAALLLSAGFSAVAVARLRRRSFADSDL